MLGPSHRGEHRDPTQITTHTLDVPGATLTYDVRRNDASTDPILFLIGAAVFARLRTELEQRQRDVGDQPHPADRPNV
jgi:hypothetical protein